MKIPTLRRCSTALAASTAAASTLTSAAGRLVWRIALRFPLLQSKPRDYSQAVLFES